jgi:hypothetical protein
VSAVICCGACGQGAESASDAAFDMLTPCAWASRRAVSMTAKRALYVSEDGIRSNDSVDRYRNAVVSTELSGTYSHFAHHLAGFKFVSSENADLTKDGHEQSIMII